MDTSFPHDAAPHAHGAPGQQEPPAELPRLARDTSPENPWPLSKLSHALHGWVQKAPDAWVEGQVIEVNERARVCYVTLRDLQEEASVSVTLFKKEMARLERPLERGSRVVVNLQADFYVKTGRLSMLGRDIRPVGLGDLLERLERLRRALADEGLFDPARKKPLPVLPHRVGLITGRNSDAEKDVVRNATNRWPGVQFEIREVPVQGSGSARAVIGALEELDAMAEVDVIVIARGGGAFEDLLSFSEESLLRAVFAARTPVVSAIGHENDQPLLDHVADVRASTPTDAGKRVVPDVHEERLRLGQARAALDRAVGSLIEREQQGLATVRSRPVLSQPDGMILVREEDLDRWRTRAWTATNSLTLRAQDSVAQMRARVRALSPQQTLDRGYAVVQTTDGSVLTDASRAQVGQQLTVRLAAGELGVDVTGTSTRQPGEH
ncbi:MULTISPECIES: exodeoxyribonuclease VII large subunit [Kocuria]|uniref:Exodeoxyribonuclease 7 large subunit n=1 Tax=Kocuria rhizophila (strain ATCC 9341 / DSM 348 / NBRC 103217 / DC2201) TaxID=378753 RepID=B2GJV2_KOCRD|nr:MULTISPECIES: exodeoxyribonuclease VII large subunit [Kocuria]ASE10983.1 exodeoxyribonuclease VII large subunit [Kocuria rhizophila]MBK4120297.1 exodeoxyribonuclease VII large subunit [Kocuria rhizophila]MCC5671248.1 exodeoxyribonuclease VII large subunit [Kocuria rhizophila]VEH75654.1 Exodeoxyribonuclease 7 large subunit [Kocuria rhizophila]BAG29057.1 exodeoxyribonuclease VII large subunit [Kocuria rhizophila DC2201]